MATTAPTVSYSSTRLVGVEIEIDGGGATYRPPAPVAGWVAHRDASLNRGGEEYVLEPAPSYSDSLPLIGNFCTALQVARTNFGKLGGYHAHVQVADYSVDDIARIVLLYAHFQRAFDKLVSPSRVKSRWAQRLPSTISSSPSGVANHFQLGFRAPTRSHAKHCQRVGRYWAVNTSMTHCVTPADRSLEFRQASSSSSPAVIIGWLTLMVAFVDISKQGSAVLDDAKANFNSGTTGLCAFLQKYARGSNLDKWVKWRVAYLAPRPTQILAGVPKLVEVLRNATAPMGLFTVARALNLSLPHAKSLLDVSVATGAVVKLAVGGGRWAAPYAAWVEQDLRTLRAALDAAPAAPEVVEVDPDLAQLRAAAVAA